MLREVSALRGLGRIPLAKSTTVVVRPIRSLAVLDRATVSGRDSLLNAALQGRAANLAF